MMTKVVLYDIEHIYCGLVNPISHKRGFNNEQYDQKTQQKYLIDHSDIVSLTILHHIHIHSDLMICKQPGKIC